MKTKEFFLSRMSIEEFAETHDLVMEIHERTDKDGLDRYYAHFEDAEVSDSNFLIGAYGNGKTPEEAVVNYAEEISGKMIVVDAMSDKRRNIIVPILVSK